MTDQNNCYAYFCIRDSFDPEQITKRLGVEPTETFREGELIPKTSMTRKTSLWGSGVWALTIPNAPMAKTQKS